MRDAVVVVTGASSGIGKATARALAAKGVRVVLACRNPDKAEAVRRDIVASTGNERVEAMPLDLASFASIRRFAESFARRYDRLNVLVNNAGLMAKKRTVTEDGLETVMGVNHFGTFLLTVSLLGPLKEAGRARIVTVSSEAHRIARIRFDDLQSERGRYRPFQVYAQSKLANILFTYELARRLHGTGVTANCLHPGVVRSSFFRPYAGRMERLFLAAAGWWMASPEKGAETSVYLASSPEVEGVTGKYFVRCRERRSSAASYDAAAAARLWELSERVTGKTKETNLYLGCPSI